jgi:hypothetical protein
MRLKSLLIISAYLFAGSVSVPGQKQSDDIVNMINDHRKSLGIKPFSKNERNMKAFENFQSVLDAIRADEAAPDRLLSYKGWGQSDRSVYLQALALQGVMDVETQVFRVTGKTVTEALSKNNLFAIPEFRAAIEDSAYNEIGYLVGTNQGRSYCIVGISKRYVDFTPGIQVSIIDGKETLIIRGHSRLDELLYDEKVSVLPSTEMVSIKPENKRQIGLDKSGNFTVLAARPGKEESLCQMVGFFDKNNKIVAYIPFYKFPAAENDPIRK